MCLLNVIASHMQSVSKQPQSTHSVADIPHNKLKNRFANIFPCKPRDVQHCSILNTTATHVDITDDSTRVKLKEIPGQDGSDYINASHLDVRT